MATKTSSTTPAPRTARRAPARTGAELRARMDQVARDRAALTAPERTRAAKDEAALQQRTDDARYRTARAASEGNADAIEILKDAASTWFAGYGISASSSDAQVRAAATKARATFATLAGQAEPAIASGNPYDVLREVRAGYAPPAKGDWKAATEKAALGGRHASKPRKGAR